MKLELKLEVSVEEEELIKKELELIKKVVRLINKEQTPPVLKVKKEKHIDNSLQKVVKGWKILNGIPTEGEESKSWDQVHFSRNAKAAKSLLNLFGYPGAVFCMEFIFDLQAKNKMDCTLETVVKRSDLYREKIGGMVR